MVWRDAMILAMAMGVPAMIRDFAQWMRRRRDGG
jgi:hypothetical protein